jgi:hypothetical protein
MALGPIAHYHSNSYYYSAHPPVLGPDDPIDERLPHITIQIPVYKESLDVVLYGLLPPLFFVLTGQQDSVDHVGQESDADVC